MSTPSPILVTAAVHTGITVTSLDRAEYIFRDLLGLKFLRHMHLRPPMSTVVGHPEAEIRAAHMELPGGHQVELLQYDAPKLTTTATTTTTTTATTATTTTATTTTTPSATTAPITTATDNAATAPSVAVNTLLPWQPGSFHLCLLVSDIHVAIETLRGAEYGGKSLGWQLLAEPRTLDEGPNRGTVICYMMDNEGLTLEIFQRPRE